MTSGRLTDLVVSVIATAPVSSGTHTTVGTNVVTIDHRLVRGQPRRRLEALPGDTTRRRTLMAAVVKFVWAIFGAVVAPS